MPDFSITENAANRIAFLLNKRKDDNVKLRISVESGGCSGFQYRYDFVTTPKTDDDLYIAQNGARVLIDETSINLIRGSQLDFVEDLSGSLFKMKNPVAASGCGCGNSFSV